MRIAFRVSFGKYTYNITREKLSSIQIYKMDIEYWPARLTSGRVWGKGVVVAYVILSRYKYHFIRVKDNNNKF